MSLFVKVKKKPVVVDAVMWDGSEADALDILSFMGVNAGHYVAPTCFEIDAPLMIIYTLEGNMAAGPGDWIIRGVNGEFYPCKDEIFLKTYEVIE